MYDKNIPSSSGWIQPQPSTSPLVENQWSMVLEILQGLRNSQARWSEDRKWVFKQLSHIEEQMKLFAEQTQHWKDQHWKEWEPTLPALDEKISHSIRDTISSCAEGLGEKLGKEAARTTEFVARQLAKAAYKAQDVIQHFQAEILLRQWGIIGVTVFTTITTCLLLVWLFIPKPALPLTEKQIQYLNDGMKMERIWPKLSEWEKAHWLSLMRKSGLSENNSK